MPTTARDMSIGVKQPVWDVVCSAALPGKHCGLGFLQVYCCWVQMMESLDMLLPALLDALNSPSEKVVVEALMVQASIAEDEDQFRQLMQFLLDRSPDLPHAAWNFQAGSLEPALHERGSFKIFPAHLTFLHSLAAIQLRVQTW